MGFRKLFNNSTGDKGRGLVVVAPVCEGCSVFVPNEDDPPLEDNLHFAISQALHLWMMKMPIRIRKTLPVMQCGNMIALFVWWDRLDQHPQGGRRPAARPSAAPG
jgi:hypothetical protein